ncbi:hypothetical protein BS47DRAFT_1487563 [Hydnum rufescens UP504]|uniref:Uncharacterized protein n=1 Tax=Hydnum rufescens UP504 TaxID=1448309 RepID=A0A9P6AQW4_9AGAM|nr:hypothetical protein BS47DRAFT_1487563 [Hydnum rufescens UP504]
MSQSSPSIPAVAAYRAPAHKHAHHLHSIPPREKTARKLILDHMLYLHAHARFIQARSELGMARPGATHLDDTEDVQALTFGVTGMDRHKSNSVDKFRFCPHVDLELAREQRAAAEGMEKVLSSLLIQNGDLNDRSDHTGSGGRPLPSGIRLRLALSALINDFFARDVHVFEQDDPPDEALHASPSDSLETPMSIASIISDPPFPPNGYPHTPISVPALPYPFLDLYPLHPSRPGSHSPWALDPMATSLRPTSASASSPSRSHAPHVWKAVGRSRELYNAGIKRRRSICVRHLTPLDECPQLCVHAAAYTSREPRQALTNIGTGLSHSGPPLRRRRRLGTGGISSAGGTGARMADLLPRFLKLSALVARELGSEMRGEQQEIYDEEPSPRDQLATNQRSSSTPSPTVTPIHSDPISTTGDARPTREWYALLSGIVTRAVLEGYLGKGWLGPDSLEVLFGLGIGVDWNTLDHIDHRQASNTTRSGSSAASPDPLRAGTPRVQDDINENDDNDGSNSTETRSTSWFGEDDMQFELDSMPTLADAAKILFGRGTPANATTSYTPAPSAPPYGFATTRWSPTFTRPGIEGGDPEWEWEMSERIAEFSTIAPQTPDLMSHLNELSARYPPEPIERAGVRFCEAVANWRGTPELEVYKSKVRIPAPSSVMNGPSTATFSPPRSASTSTSVASTSPTPTMTSNTPNIFSYFAIPGRVKLSGVPSSRKRPRDDIIPSALTGSVKRRM